MTKGQKILIGGIGLLAVGVGAYFLYKKFKPRQTFAPNINTPYEELKKRLEAGDIINLNNVTAEQRELIREYRGGDDVRLAGEGKGGSATT